jgi:tRNA nucleotidyltransferase (CCA-adding enzyme)
MTTTVRNIINKGQQFVMTSKIQLTVKERQLCNLLLKVVKSNSLSTTMRIAGGWVRDKLLGLSSTDIDISLDNMMGKDFAMLVNQYLSAHHLPTHHIGIIQTNPEQSKHLETATVHVLDFWIDFVNLRSEVYTQDSRIPSEVGFGTPEEDALRRDITINALFYNLNQDCIEDFTGRGLADLHDGIIRTPLTPLETFMDDPLRILRVIRFASRFNYEIEKDVFKAIHHPGVVKALGGKVSRERIGTEVAKMLQGIHPLLSVTLLIEAGLFDVVFLRPASASNDHLTLISDNIGKDALNITMTVDAIIHGKESLFGTTVWTVAHQDRRWLYLAAILAPLRACKALNKQGKLVEEPMAIIRDSLKLPTKEAITVQNILTGADTIREFIHENVVFDTVSRKDMGCLVRRLGAIWSLSLAIAYALEKQQDASSSYLCKYGELSGHIDALGLSQAYSMMPLLNGHLIQSVLNIEYGPLIGYYHEKIIEWQLEHSKGTVDECLSWLKQQVESHKHDADKSIPLSPAVRKKFKIANTL